MPETLAIACDHAGVELKNQLKEELKLLGYDAADLGTDGTESVDYPDYANSLAEWMNDNPGSLGVLICGSGIGISIAANRHKHVRAALCYDGLSAELSRRHNDANVICFGARLMGIETAKDALKRFLKTPYEGGRHQARVDKLG